MSTAFTVPAFAEIETVVVTAERKAEDIQTVPIAVTALTGADLKSKQVNSFRDLQFHVPSVTYTKSNFGGAQFQIRGITTQFGLGAAIAQNQNDIYLEAPSLVTGQYFDVDRVEVARGPQSTSYGRAATGGAVNIITSKPNLDEFQARASFDYGSFNTMKPELMVNVPIIDGVLGVRVAALGVFHDGYEKNQYAGPQIYPGVPVHDAINGQGTAGGRLSVRWEPSANTTIDITAELGYENDSRVRGDKQECHRDSSGVVGCLPDRLGFDPINLNSTLGATLGSKQGLTALMNNTFGVGFGTASFLGNTVGLFNLGGNGGPGDPAGPGGAVFLGPGSPGPAGVNGVGSGAGGVVSPDLLTSNTAFNPKYTGNNAVYTFNWSQNINSWLKSTVDFGYTNSKSLTRQDYNDGPPPNISTLIGPSVAGFNAVLGPFAAPYDAAYFNVPGSIPISSVFYNGTFGSYGGIIDNTRGGILTKTPFFTTYDEDNFSSRELTGEVRFQTSFEGPINFSAGAFWMSFQSRNQYWVASSSLDFEAIAIGGLNRALTFAGLGIDQGPIVTALPAFDAEYRRGDVQSRSAFLEGTWDIIPDSLKIIAGARYNDDRSSLLRTPIPVGGGLLTNGFALIGSTTVTLPVNVNSPSIASTPAAPLGPNNVTDLWTGRVTVNWTPKLSWTDQTLVYATASRGELAGGINVANNAQAAAVVPTVFQPATVDALEFGTKNTLLDGSLQANLDVWYYNYENYQVGIIANRQALTLNIPAHLMGFEGEFVWQPEDDLAFNLTLSLTQSAAGTSFVSDERNPTAGVPNNIFVKDLTNGSNCVVQPLTGATAGHTPGESNPVTHVKNFYLPNGGNAAIDAPFGIPLVNYGICAPGSLYTTATNLPTEAPWWTPALIAATGHPIPTNEDALEHFGFQYTLARSPTTGAVVNALDPISHVVTPLHDGNGNVVNLHGNQLPQVPNAQVGVGAQWTAHLGGDFTLVPRVDYYWQSSFQSRVWNDANIDRVNGWDTMNAQIQLNAPENKWYARVFATNLFDKRNPTGVYLTDPTSALYTNVFSEDPRVLGVSVGASW
jgi:outer membrane receptor protein involved in Fe transport